MNGSLYMPEWIASGALNATGTFYIFGNGLATYRDYAQLKRGARDYRTALLTWQWAGTSTPNGTYKIIGNNQTGLATETWYDLYLDANKVYGNVNGSVYSHAGGTTISVNSASAGYLSVTLEPTHPHLALVWTRTGGGSATGLTAGQAHFRAV